MKPESFFDKYGEYAVKACEGTKLFPSVLLAQMALESDWGDSLLSSKYNNFFGEKISHDWTGDKVRLFTHEYIKGKMRLVPAYFKAYPSPLESLKGRNSLLERVPTYREHGVFDAKTPEEQAEALQKAGYATDPNYAEKLISIIKQFNLYQYDRLLSKNKNQNEKEGHDSV